MCLLNQLRHDDDDIYGIMSSHPAACLAAAKAFGSKCISISVINPTLNITGSINTVRPKFVKEHAERIMRASPIRYVKDAKLRGSLFNPEDASGLVSSVDAGFWIDHTEPLEALAWARDIVDGLLVICMMAMSSFLFLKPGAVPDLRLGPRRVPKLCRSR